MAVIIALLVVLLLLLLYIMYHNRYNINNTVEIYSTADGYKYKVHRAHEDYIAAANTLAEINKRIMVLITHLKKKYPNYRESIDMNREKNNNIDIIPISSDSNLSHERARLLIERYDPSHMVENSPLNSDSYTAYTENKGEVIAICLRAKEQGYDIHDINLIMFVVLHELAHISNQSVGHDEPFWRTFKWILKEGVESKIYDPEDYGKTPEKYCGLVIDYNPLWDIHVKA